jgi:hypothetical protein
MPAFEGFLQRARRQRTCGRKWRSRNSIVEFTQAELGKAEADIANTDAQYRYRLTEIVLAYTIAAPK